MTLTIDLPLELEQTVRQQAARRGQKISEFVVRAIEAQLAHTRACDPVLEAVPVATHGKRGFSADEVIALLHMPQPAPDDAQCQQIVEEELLRKYGP